MRGAIAMPGDIRHHFAGYRMANRGLVVEVAVAERAGFGEAGMRHPKRAKPALCLRTLPGQRIIADIFSAGEFLDLQQFRPLLPADHGETLAIIRHIRRAQHFKRHQHLLLGQAIRISQANTSANRFLRRAIQRGDNQFISLTAKRIGAGIGNDAAFINIAFDLVQFINPFASVIILQEAFRVAVGKVHHRHGAVARLGGGGAFAHAREDGGSTLHTRFAAHGGAQLAALALIGFSDFGFELFDEGFFNGSGHACACLSFGVVENRRAG